MGEVEVQRALGSEKWDCEGWGEGGGWGQGQDAVISLAGAQAHLHSTSWTVDQYPRDRNYIGVSGVVDRAWHSRYHEPDKPPYLSGEPPTRLPSLLHALGGRYRSVSYA